VCQLREGGRLADIAPTMLGFMGLPVPKEMTGQYLRRYAQRCEKWRYRGRDYRERAGSAHHRNGRSKRDERGQDTDSGRYAFARALKKKREYVLSP
jgi:hypothetical protein